MNADFYKNFQSYCNLTVTNKVVKPEKDGKDYSTDLEVTATLADEDIDLVAVFEIIPGEIEAEVDNKNVGGAVISNTIEEIKELVELTDDEKAEIAAGKNIYIYLEMEDISDSVSDEDKKIVSEKLDKNTIGMYLDISLFKQVQGQDKIKVEKSNNKVKISFEIPEELRKDNRTYMIIKVHEGKAETITPTRDENTLTFETDEFSTYALTYKDETNPKTGDSIAIWMSLMVFATLGVIATTKFAKK